MDQPFQSCITLCVESNAIHAYTHEFTLQILLRLSLQKLTVHFGACRQFLLAGAVVVFRCTPEVFVERFAGREVAVVGIRGAVVGMHTPLPNGPREEIHVRFLPQVP